MPRSMSHTMSALPGSSLRFKIVFSIIRPIFFNLDGKDTLTFFTLSAIPLTNVWYVVNIFAACWYNVAGSEIVCFVAGFLGGTEGDARFGLGARQLARGHIGVLAAGLTLRRFTFLKQNNANSV